MSHLQVSRFDEIAVVRLNRGKVNALNHDLVLELHSCFDRLRQDPSVRSVVLTGKGKFFTFGFDIPEFISWSKEDFTRYLSDFTALYTRLFEFPRPVVAALNGHTIAGGCMIALACDRRIMATGKGKISLNEITFGASVFAGCVEMLKLVTGDRSAERILFSGAMYDAEEALELGLVDSICTPDDLQACALNEARTLTAGDGVAFESIKKLLRGPTARMMREREPASIREFADIWYSEPTWKRLEKIEIRKD